MKRKLILFFTGSLALWTLATPVGWWLSGNSGVLFTTSALLLCLVPMGATMLWVSWSQSVSPERQLTALMGGTAARMVFVIVGGIVLFRTVEVFNDPSFLFWVIFFYLATLAIEIAMLVGFQ